MIICVLLDAINILQLISVNIPAFEVVIAAAVAAAPYNNCQGFEVRSLESADYQCLGDAKSDGYGHGEKREY